MPHPYQKVFLIMLDGLGLAGRESGNAILEQGVPYLDSLIARYPTMAIAASGLVVGLPWGQPGNSEVGHSAVGTGRIVIQDLAHINGEIRNENFYRNPAILSLFDHAKAHDSAVHFIGCTSPGGIHAHTDHLIALLEMAARRGHRKTFVHFIADGQDMPPQDAINVLHTLAPYLKKSGARIASISGRSFAMDRVNNWAVTEKVWHAVVVGDAPHIQDVQAYLEQSYEKGETDYSIPPATVVDGETPIGAISDNDAVMFFDYRNDRVRQLAQPFILSDSFTEFERIRIPKNVRVVTMTKYADEYAVPIAYSAPELPMTLGEVVSKVGSGQWRIAEKEKEAHVTNFFNGGRITAFAGEQRDIVSSRKMRGPEYLQHPEMSAQAIVDSVLAKADDASRLYVINFANPDMIAHTGNFEASKKAMKVTDDSLRQLVETLRARTDSAVVITADHGNAEELIDPLSGGEDTQHSTRNVPVLFIAPELDGKGDSLRTMEGLAQEPPLGTLVDIAPSVLYLLGIPQPQDMTGSQLISV